MRGKSQWIRVSGSSRCPICDSPDWCGVTADGSVARCMRVQSAKEVTGADGSIGWLHKLSPLTTPVPPPRAVKEPKRLGVAELTKIAKRMFEHERADLRRRQVADQLGVTLDSLIRLRVGYGAERDGREFSSWPARNWRGDIVGIVRRYDDGAKKSYAGGSTGLFYDLEWDKRPGVVLIVEGGSDTAAAISCGLAAIGRPSNTGGASEIRRMLSASRARTCRKLIVVGEDDRKPEKIGQECPKDCPGCSRCFPGKFGAEIVSRELSCPWVMPPAGCKDFRVALNTGKVWPQLLMAV